MGCSAEGIAGALRAAALVVADHRVELIELDRAIGDADHGENMNRGFTAIVSALDTAAVENPGALLKLAATTLISKVGGAAGPLYGTGFLRAATSLGSVSEVDSAAVAAALRAALDGVQARGKAVAGDKTMVDALIPAVAAAEAAVESGAGADIATVLGAAASAAADGAESTVDMVARKGRASYLGQRSAGHLDPGARSSALILGAFAKAASEATR
jgi:dihydroxyacetone kinase-like protein